MSDRQTLARALHDLGAAAWFGGSLMGAVGLNGAAADAQPAERTQLAARGWARWAPVNAAAIGAHLVGGALILAKNRGRVQRQPAVARGTVVKTVVTAAALGVSAYGAYLGRTILAEPPQSSSGATEPGQSTSARVAAAQRQLQVLQWITPALTGAIVVLGAQQGEQQRPLQQFRQTLTDHVPNIPSLVHDAKGHLPDVKHLLPS